MVRFRFGATCLSLWLLAAAPGAAQDIIELPAEDSPLAADFEEVFRVGSLDAPDWQQFGVIFDVAFVERDELGVNTVVVKRVAAVP